MLLGTDPKGGTGQAVALSQGVLCCLHVGGLTIPVEKGLKCMALRICSDQECPLSDGLPCAVPSAFLRKEAIHLFRQTRSSSKVAGVCCSPV